MNYRELLFGNRLLAILLAVDGVLNAVLLSDLLFAIPFLLAAAEFFFTPGDWQYAKWLVLFSLVAGIGSLLSSLSILIDGVMRATALTIAEGVALSGLNVTLIALLVRRTSPYLRRLRSAQKNRA
jgi:hypothetical protein